MAEDRDGDAFTVMEHPAHHSASSLNRASPPREQATPVMRCTFDRDAHVTGRLQGLFDNPKTRERCVVVAA